MHSKLVSIVFAVAVTDVGGRLGSAIGVVRSGRGR